MVLLMPSIFVVGAAEGKENSDFCIPSSFFRDPYPATVT